MDNFKKIQDTMKQVGLQSLLLTDNIDRQYASGFYSDDSAVIIFQDDAYYITDSRFTEAAEEAVKNAHVVITGQDHQINNILKEQLEKHGATQMGIEEESISYKQFSNLTKLFPNVELVQAQAITKALRQSKARWEVDNMIKAQRIAEGALDYILGFIKPGVTEKQIAAELEYRMRLGGAEGVSFETIAVGGSNTSRPHGVPTNYKVQKGDFITMDFGCKYNGYCSDMTRTVALGEPTEEMKKVYNTVLEAQLAAIEAAEANKIGKDIDKVARDIIEKAGYGQYFGHSLGHSVGLYIHETPNAAPHETNKIPVGAVITSEPGIYIPGKFGVRIEDMIYLTKDGVENLTKAPKNLIIL